MKSLGWKYIKITLKILLSVSRALLEEALVLLRISQRF
jgi:hypothetical protein